MLLAEGDIAGRRSIFRCWCRAAAVSQGFELPAAGVDLEQLERDLVVQALARTGGNQTRAPPCSVSIATRSAIASRSSASRSDPRRRRGIPQGAVEE